MKISKLLCVLLSAVLVICLAGSGFAVSLDDNSGSNLGTGKDDLEEKVFSKASLEDEFADNRVLVVLKNSASLKLKTFKESDFTEVNCVSVNDLSTSAATRVNAKMSGKGVASLYPDELETVVFSDFYDVDTEAYNQILCLTLSTNSKQSVLDAIDLLMEREDVKYAGPDYMGTVASTTPNDTYYSSQWALSKIQMPQAWDINKGSESIMIGVLDSGIAATHPDLSGKVLTRISRDCTSGTAVRVSSVTDPFGHGTKVASVIGADSNNATGMAGIVWNTNLVSLRVADSSGRAYSSWTIAAINYATSAGIPILNLSVAWTSLSATDQYDEPLNECIENYPGLIVCAAGNNSADLAYNNYYSYPSEFTASNLLVVGSSTQNDTIAEHSNYGAVSVDLFAPGEGIYMAKRTGGYTTDVGTSFAAPHVTGVAALLLFECNTITVARMKSVILNRTDKLSAFTSNCVSGGRLNAYKALTNAHLYSYTRTATTHTGTCSCGETKTEPHNFIQIGDRSLCPDCGYKRSTNPVRSN